MRTFKSIVLAGAMLLATPAFFSSCQENAPEIDYEMKVTVVNDFTKVVDAINNSSLSNEQAIAKLVAAIDQMNVDQQTKLQAIMEAITSVNNTLETKLAAIEAAMRAQTLSMESKLALIEQVISSLNTTLETKLGAIQAALKEQTISMEAKMDLIKGILSNLNTTLEVKLGAIEAAMKEQTIALKDKLALIEQVIKDQTSSFDAKMELLIKAITSLPDYSEKLAAIEAAIKAMPDYSEQLKAIEQAMKDMNATLTEKLAILESIQSAISDNGKKLAAIEQAIKAMPDYGQNITAINTEIINLLQAVKDGGKSETDAMAEIARKIEELKINAGLGTPTATMEWVDLGLPSGIKWARCNLGAKSPEKLGDWYAWGETKTKYDFTWDNYWLADGKFGNYKRYDSKDKLTQLLPCDDAATVQLGVGWAIPSFNEMKELYKYCSFTEVVLNGIKGIMAVSNINKNYIFFPYSSRRDISLLDYRRVTILTSTLRKIDSNNYSNCAGGKFGMVDGIFKTFEDAAFRRDDAYQIRPICRSKK